MELRLRATELYRLRLSLSTIGKANFSSSSIFLVQALKSTDFDTLVRHLVCCHSQSFEGRRHLNQGKTSMLGIYTRMWVNSLCEFCIEMGNFEVGYLKRDKFTRKTMYD